MGLLVDALKLALPERKVAVGATVPTWAQGNPQYPSNPYHRLSQAYSTNEIAFAAIEELASSAAEPCIAAYRKAAKEPERLLAHPVLDLFERPNPFCDKYQFIAGIIMYMQIAGNVFIEKVRSRAGGVVELWLLRPDRVRVIPDRDKFVRGYLYELGDFRDELPSSDVIHLRTRNPNAMDAGSDFYGMPPLAVCVPRIEADVAMRAFTGAFFRNAGVPAGLLTISKAVSGAEREMIRNRWRGETGGPSGWHSLMVLDSTDAAYTPMGMPLGERGLVMPELDEIFETRISMPFGVPLELIGARLGMIHGNRSTLREARAGFWDETLAPLYVMLACGLTNGLVDDFDFDYLEFDTSTVKALAEDQDAKHKRIRDTMLAGLITREEARQALDYDPEPNQQDTWLLGPRITEVAVDAPPPAPVAPAASALASPAATVTGAEPAAPATNGAVHV